MGGPGAAVFVVIVAGVLMVSPPSVPLEQSPLDQRDEERDEPLRSGWAWGQHYLEGGLAGIEASLGKGKVFLFGPEITFRYQPHGTFKFLFNGIYYGSSTPVGTPGRETTAPR